MTPAQLQLARRRLALGITNVGFWVLAATGGICWLLWRGTGATGPGEVGLVLAGAVAAQACFDLVGGTWLMPPPVPTLGRFLRGWLRGMGGHTLVLVVVGALSYGSFRLSGGFTLAIVLATAGLTLGRRFLLRLLGGVPTAEVTREDATVLVARADDPAFTGGIVGWGTRARSLLPVAWLEKLPREELATESSRREWQQEEGLPGRAILSILGWNLLGASVGSLAFGLAQRSPAGALLLYACWMTLWTFGSLLLLPSLSRRTVFAADRAARAAGHDPRSWIAHFPALVGEDGGSGPLVQTIFYPVPSAQRRLQQLADPSETGFLPGNLARNNLYYSWATCTLLGRAVHCNVGRPALWVFPPSV